MLTGKRRRLIRTAGWIDHFAVPVRGLAVGIALGAALGLLLSLATPSSEPTAEDAVENTVQTFLGAIGHDGKKACLQLSSEARDELRRREDAGSCERAAADSTGPHSDLASQFDFGTIRFGPAHKSALVLSEHADGEELRGLHGEYLGVLPQGLFPPVELELGDGHWRITKLDWYFEGGW